MKYEDKTIDFRSIKEMPLEDRPREKLLAAGPFGMSDIELLCLVVGSGSKRRPVQDIAQDILLLMNEKGSCEISVNDLSSIPGVGKANASRICACLEIGRRFSFFKPRLCKEPKRIFELVRHYGDRLQEHFIVVILNGAHELMGVNVVTVGLVNRTLVHPREVFSEPLKMRATAIVLAHNHPSGNIMPSKADNDLTKSLLQACNLMRLKFMDHVIVTDGAYYSYNEQGM